MGNKQAKAEPTPQQEVTKVRDFQPPDWVDEMATYNLSGMEVCVSGYEYKCKNTVIVLSRCGRLAGRAIFDSGQGKIESAFEGQWRKQETDIWDTEDEGNIYVEYSLSYFGYTYEYEGNLSELHAKYHGRFSRKAEENVLGQVPDNERGEFKYELKPLGKAIKGAKKAEEEEEEIQGDGEKQIIQVNNFQPPSWVEPIGTYDLSGMEICVSGYEYKCQNTVIVLSKCGKLAGRAIFESGQGKIESGFEGLWRKQETDIWDTEDEGNVYVEYSLPYFGFTYSYSGNLSELHLKYHGRFSKKIEPEVPYDEIPDNEKGEFKYDLKPVGKAIKGAKRAG